MADVNANKRNSTSQCRAGHFDIILMEVHIADQATLKLIEEHDPFLVDNNRWHFLGQSLLCFDYLTPKIDGHPLISFCKFNEILFVSS